MKGIDTLILRVSDVQRSMKWYIEKLEFDVLHEDEDLRLVVLDTFSPVSLTLWETVGEIRPDPQTASYPIFSAADARSVHQLLKDRGVSAEDLVTDHSVTYFTFRDPDLNILEVCQVHE